MGRLLIFGLGYTAKRIAALAKERGWHVSSTGSDGDLDFADTHAVGRAMHGATHILSSVPPADGGDPVLENHGETLPDCWLGYLSSSGVYGDTEGAWVDESAQIGTGRRTARAECDAAWLARGAFTFRLPGIYGPGRSAFERIANGKARRIDLPGQVFSRVHVDDIANGVVAAMESRAPAGAYNLADDLPASQNAVVEYACRLSEHELPPLQSLAEAGLSDMARGFYAENRRVANGRAKRLLGWQPLYPTFREGLTALAPLALPLAQ